MKSGRRLRVLILFDLSRDLSEEQYQEYLRTEEWESERHVVNTLKKMGHDVELMGLFDDIGPLVHRTKEDPPDVVFNMSEAFDQNRQFEPHVAALIELLKVPHTGSGPEALRLCKDKSLAKKVLAYHEIQVPKFDVVRRSAPTKSLGAFPFPAIIKPLDLESSEGIAQVSLVADEKEAMERIRFIHEKYETDAIIEEYIDGRELYVGVIGNERLQVLPPRELFFREVPEGEPKFATYRAKWDDAYRKRWGIENGSARGLSEEDEARLADTCKKIYRALQLKGYARIDLRMRANGEFVFIEANPNPSIAKEDDFAKAAAKAGIDYETLIGRLISLAGVA